MNQDRRFVFDAGTLALDLLNTWRLDGDLVQDLLGSPEDGLAWLTAAGLPLEAWFPAFSSSPPNRRILLDEALWLRQDIFVITQSLVAGKLPPPQTVHALNRILIESGRSFRLHSVVITSEHPSSELGVLQPIALSAALLATEANPLRIRQCASEDCIYWFLDTSKSGRRRWCSMARCGNRAKVAKHYRQRSTPL